MAATMRDGATPVLTCAVWQHACSIDDRDARTESLDRFWDFVNWDFVAANPVR